MPLLKLRLTFLAVGVILVAAILLLFQSSMAQLQDQRRLRHEVVSERVFDEVERELSNVLLHEAERPSEAYDATATDPERWAPFVVGYYRRSANGLTVIAANRLPTARSKRIRSAVEQAQAELSRSAAVSSSTDASTDASNHQGSRSSPGSPDVLRQLNRSVKVRERRQRGLTESLRVVSVDSATIVIERRSEKYPRFEGFVIDFQTMISTMEAWVVGSQGLNTVAALAPLSAVQEQEPSSPGWNPWIAPEAYHYTHRLAAPLDSQSISLRLARLADQDAARTLYVLTPLLLLAVVAGLLALYRTVLVRLRFSEQRNNFVAAVTHELKTPLTAIRMYGEMLRDGIVENEQTRQRYYETITAEGERLTRLVNNVLEHGRLQRGQRPTNIESAQVPQLVQEVVAFMGPHLKEQGFDVRFEFDRSLPAAQLDVDAFKQVLYNLLENALKYGFGEQRREIAIRCRVRHGFVNVSIRDHGPGVSEAQLRNIFEPFFRGQDELTRSQAGTGIGLSLVRDLVDLMGGKVHALNHRPGLEIQLDLPAAPAD